MKQVKEFWDSMAEKHGSSNLATAPDGHYRKLEINKIIDAIAGVHHHTILDVGCGNGYTTKKIADWLPESEIIGIDYSEAMIIEANKEPLDGVQFFHGDALSLSTLPELKDRKFDVVLSSRCLINLDGWAKQQEAIQEMLGMIAKGGALILVENCKEGLANLNRLRDQFGLPAIKERWHNHLLSREELFKYMYYSDMYLQHKENIGNLYYVASRVIYAKMCQDERVEPNYDHPINWIASALPTMGDYEYSPNYLFVYTNGSINGAKND